MFIVEYHSNILGSVLFNIFINEVDNETEGIITKLTYKTVQTRRSGKHFRREREFKKI